MVENNDLKVTIGSNGLLETILNKNDASIVKYKSDLMFYDGKVT